MDSDLLPLQDYVDYWYDSLNDVNEHKMHNYVYQYIEAIGDEDSE